MAPNRSPADVVRGLDATGLAHVCVDTAEADDIIATVAAQSQKRSPERDVWIMSNDRDFYQLVDVRTRILNTARRPGQRVIDEAEIEARFGVTPAQWCDRTSLVGDPSDGIRGVHGVGPVTAGRLLAGGMTVEQLPESGRLTGRVGDLIGGSLEEVVRWKRMVRMRTDHPVPAGLLTRSPSRDLPRAPSILEMLDLW
jgi:DNA polymerase-1